MQNLAENNLLEGLIQGDHKAFEQLYKKEYNVLFAKAMKVLGDAEKAKDAINEVFLQLWERNTFRNVTVSPEAYVLVIIHHKCLRMITTGTKDRTKLKDVPFTNSDEDSDQEPSLEKINRLKLATGKLSENQRIAITKIYWQKLSYKQAAEQMGISVNSFNEHMKRAMQKYRKLFD
ncbi:RNA polymerase sigma-70 factor, ECF subfamily [Chitinophaga sp. YR573]|uniref:RNA polymerase sigma factor n=1 Tax=Chitinophaga sp. YR573 TaxID=1881040 RepID=UPI0008BA590A|nr:sigma-70 family RNA polymerase sigma factor [Chitinophaga sp. YR573]SEW21102.1 RNA polymerase sigma-70 factor, ECF subfamily [Chitinophaga sp. YR573]